MAQHLLKWTTRGSDLVSTDEVGWNYIVSQEQKPLWTAAAWRVYNNVVKRDGIKTLKSQHAGCVWCEGFAASMQKRDGYPTAEEAIVLSKIKVEGHVLTITGEIPSDWKVFQNQINLAQVYVATLSQNRPLYKLFYWGGREWNSFGGTYTLDEILTQPGKLKEINVTQDAAMTNTTDTTEVKGAIKVADFMVQDKEPQDDYLHRPLFDVNMRLFRQNVHYKALVLQACDYIAYASEQDFSDYPKTRGVSAANLGIPFNIACFWIKGTKYVIINPKVVNRSTDTKPSKTNCGSFNLPDKVEVERPFWIEVRGYTLDGIECGAKITDGAGTAEHEIEHNLGITIIDKAAELTKKKKDEVIKVTAKPLPPDDLSNSFDNPPADSEVCCKCQQLAMYYDEVGLGANLTRKLPHCGVHHIQFEEENGPEEIAKTGTGP